MLVKPFYYSICCFTLKILHKTALAESERGMLKIGRDGSPVIAYYLPFVDRMLGKAIAISNLI